jgi:hypothetical protein
MVNFYVFYSSILFSSYFLLSYSSDNLSAFFKFLFYSFNSCTILFRCVISCKHSSLLSLLYNYVLFVSLGWVISLKNANLPIIWRIDYWLCLKDTSSNIILFLIASSLPYLYETVRGLYESWYPISRIGRFLSKNVYSSKSLQH